MRRRALLAGAVLAGASARADDDALGRVLDGSWRSPANRARDAARHPLQTLAFFGLKPAMTVVELAPGAGWYTEILAPYLHERGLLYAALEAGDDAYRVRSRAAFGARLAQAPALFGRVRLATLPALAEVPTASVDCVLALRHLHNLLQPPRRLDATLQAITRVLRPGGVLGVEEHRAAAGTPLAQMQRSGYVGEALVAERARAAGLVLQARSEINANARDTADHPHGVWSLPPTLRGADDDPVQRQRALAIGESDRFTHRYVKPP